ncbi:MAG: TPM domain-containing protein [Chthoniobacteraceae bacterium]|nr:TPM domain-containing protein [Chthoniobacteraceae bacterium]
MKPLCLFAKCGLIFLLALWSCGALAAEVIPPPPKAYFNDEAGVARKETASRLNRELEQFERDTSNQIVVAVFPKMQSDSSIEDYTVRVAHAWRVGQKGLNNGAVLFVFVQDRKMYIQVGYGLEGTLTDYLCSQIINNELKPRFRAGDFDGGLSAAVHAMIAATKGEYKGSGQTVADRNTVHPQPRHQGGGFGLIGTLFLFFFIWVIFRILGGISGGNRPSGGGPIFFGDSGGSGFGGGGFSGGGGFDSGGGGGGGGGGFSGGGGDFGGGGAGGSW